MTKHGLAEHDDDTLTAEKAGGRSFTQKARLGLGLVLLVVVAAIVVDNRRSTRIGYVFGDVRVPLVVALLIAGLLGALIGWLLLHRPGRRS